MARLDNYMVRPVSSFVLQCPEDCHKAQLILRKAGFEAHEEVPAPGGQNSTKNSMAYALQAFCWLSSLQSWLGARERRLQWKKYHEKLHGNFTKISLRYRRQSLPDSTQTCGQRVPSRGAVEALRPGTWWKEPAFFSH